MLHRGKIWVGQLVAASGRARVRARAPRALSQLTCQRVHARGRAVTVQRRLLLGARVGWRGAGLRNVLKRTPDIAGGSASRAQHAPAILRLRGPWRRRMLHVAVL